MTEKPAAQVDMEMPERSLVPHDSLSVRHANIGGAEGSSDAAPASASAQRGAAKQRRPSLQVPKPSWRVLAISAVMLVFALGAALAVEAGRASRLQSSSRAQQRQYTRLELEYKHLLASSSNHTTPLSVHVLDTSLGVPGGGMTVTAEALAGGAWAPLGRAVTAVTGRASAGLLPSGGQLDAGTYRLTFNTSEYYAALGQRCFYPEVAITFRVDDPAQHYHIPLLVSPFGYSTYRGS